MIACKYPQSAHRADVPDKHPDRVLEEIQYLEDDGAGSKDQRPKSKKRRIHCLDTKSIIVERPIPFKSEISFSNTCRSRLEIDNMGWAFEGVQRYCEVGFNPKELIDLMDSIPKDLADIMQQGCNSLKFLASIDNERLAELHPTPPAVSCQESTYDQLQDRLWQRREDCGYFRVRWDPVTQRRTHASVNAFCASLTGLHPEVRSIATYSSHPQTKH
jgi:hypothetical protein